LFLGRHQSHRQLFEHFPVHLAIGLDVRLDLFSPLPQDALSSAMRYGQSADFMCGTRGSARLHGLLHAGGKVLNHLVGGLLKMQNIPQMVPHVGPIASRVGESRCWCGERYRPWQAKTITQSRMLLTEVAYPAMRAVAFTELEPSSPLAGIGGMSESPAGSSKRGDYP
jgi:hypothetical protein